MLFVTQGHQSPPLAGAYSAMGFLKTTQICFHCKPGKVYELKKKKDLLSLTSIQLPCEADVCEHLTGRWDDTFGEVDKWNTASGCNHWQQTQNRILLFILRSHS